MIEERGVALNSIIEQQVSGFVGLHDSERQMSKGIVRWVSHSSKVKARDDDSRAFLASFFKVPKVALLWLSPPHSMPKYHRGCDLKIVSSAKSFGGIRHTLATLVSDHPMSVEFVPTGTNGIDPPFHRKRSSSNWKFGCFPRSGKSGSPTDPPPLLFWESPFRYVCLAMISPFFDESLASNHDDRSTPIMCHPLA